MSLKKRLLFGFLILVLGIAISTTASVYSFNTIADKYSRLVSQSVPKLGDLSGLRNRGRQTHTEILVLNMEGLTEQARQKSFESLKKAVGRYDEISKEFADRGFSTDNEKTTYEKTVEHWKKVAVIANEVISYIEDGKKGRSLSMEAIADLNEKVATHQKTLCPIASKTNRSAGGA